MTEEKEDGLVFSTVLKRVRCQSEPTDDSSQWVTRKIRTVKAGTLEGLTGYLIPNEVTTDVSAYRACFLATYRTFAEPGVVISILTGGTKPTADRYIKTVTW